MWGMLGMLQTKNVAGWLAETPLTSFQLILAAGALLVVAAVLLWVQRRTRIAVDSSTVSDELMIYLARIASALERPLPQGPNIDDVTREVLLRLEQMANAKPNGKVKEMPQSMFGREFRVDG
jgi:hypothetical protein